MIIIVSIVEQIRSQIQIKHPPDSEMKLHIEMIFYFI